PRQGVIDAEMAGMPGIAQPVDDPELEVFQVTPTIGRNVAHIGRIGSIADPVTERLNLAVLQAEGRERDRTALPVDGAAFSGFDREIVEDRRIVAARRRDEA